MPLESAGMGFHIVLIQCIRLILTVDSDFSVIQRYCNFLIIEQKRNTQGVLF